MLPLFVPTLLFGISAVEAALLGTGAFGASFSILPNRRRLYGCDLESRKLIQRTTSHLFTQGFGMGGDLAQSIQPTRE